MPFLSISGISGLGGGFGSPGFDRGGITATQQRALAGAFTPTIDLVGNAFSGGFDIVSALQRTCSRYLAGDMQGLPGTIGSGTAESPFIDRRVFCTQVVEKFPLSEAQRMSFIGDLIGGIGDAAKAIGGGLLGAAGAVVGALPTIAQGAASAASAIQAIQMSLSGNPTVPVNPTTGSPMPMAMGMATNPLAAYSAALAAECGMMPTPQCGSNFDARLQAFTAALGGASNMSMPINPMTGTPGVVGAGIGTDLVTLLRMAAMNPAAVAALRAVGLGALIGAGEVGVQSIAGALSGGGGGAIGVRGPLLMQWPAQTPYPRGIVLRAPDKPEKGYRSKGSALLLSGDVAAVRRVQKAATRARRGRRYTRSSARTVYALPAPGGHHVCGSCLSSPCGCGGK